MDIQPLFACAVGMDVHLMVIHVCVIVQVQDNEPEVQRRQFGTFKRDLRAMADWIAAFSPDTVVMEATFIYWKSPYSYLERVGLRALVVNAQHVKQVPGRKTDTRDAEWLAMLARAGRLARQFYPAGTVAQSAPNQSLPPTHHRHAGGGEKPLG
jgi:transposase